MTDEQIKQAAIERGCIEGTAEYYGFIQGARFCENEMCELEEKHEEDGLEMDYLRSERKFYKEFIDYLYDRAIGDKAQIIEAVSNNMHNGFVGYVKVEKSLDSQQHLILEFEPESGAGKYRAEWQPSDNYACWQRCEFEDSYNGYLLFPTYNDKEYFCMWYSC